MRLRISLLILVLCLLRCAVISGQQSKFDTVFIKKSISEGEFDIDTLFIIGGRSSIQVLAGTTFLPYSEKSIELLNRGLRPIELKIINECDDKNLYSSFNDFPKFERIYRKPDELVIEVSIIANCCYNFLGEAEVLGNDTLNLIYTAYGGFCSCECCYTLQYSFKTSLEENQERMRFVKINGDTTVARIPELH